MSLQINRHNNSQSQNCLSLGGWSLIRKLSGNGFEDVFETNRRGTWTINAVIGKVKS
jgi:hypothetical protein